MPPGAIQDRFEADFIVELEVRFPIFFMYCECIGVIFDHHAGLKVGVVVNDVADVNVDSQVLNFSDADFRLPTGYLLLL